jgi:hypothetical protein
MPAGKYQLVFVDIYNDAWSILIRRGDPRDGKASV